MEYFLKIYTFAFCIAFILILLRKDAVLIIDELIKITFRDRILLTIFSVFLLYVILPLTIPFSIMNILKR